MRGLVALASQKSAKRTRNGVLKGEVMKMGIAFIKVAAVYLLVGVCLGLYMGIAEKFEYTAPHAHINLLGWATMALFGLIYHFFPRAGNSKLGKIHFWLHNIGTLALILGMVFFANENEAIALPLAIPGAILVIIATLVFLVNVFQNLENENRV
ncbi:cbb3-type cytochrome c oxidase subunit I [Planococcus sp. YIM B11945]|uniref:cbb3-type cytochrome c oxidase subunit I n=1 Tax=Planococcus sp. YIM B11945 TaxID=3435410 RepID=UPI003D7E9CBC